jgi:hypothetical protein
LGFIVFVIIIMARLFLWIIVIAGPAPLLLGSSFDFFFFILLLLLFEPLFLFTVSVITPIFAMEVIIRVVYSPSLLVPVGSSIQESRVDPQTYHKYIP